MRVQDILTQQPMAQVEARLCRRTDVNCSEPQSPVVLSDERGLVRFDVENEDPVQGFTGYARLTRNDLMPALYFFNPPIEGSTEMLPVQLLRLSVVGALTQQVGVSLNFERGVVLLSAFDCRNEPAAGVTVTTDDPSNVSELFYSVGGLPQATATSTDDSGYAGLINVPPGKLSITGRLMPTRRVLGTINLLVGPGSITYSRMVPLGI